MLEGNPPQPEATKAVCVRTEIFCQQSPCFDTRAQTHYNPITLGFARPLPRSATLSVGNDRTDRQDAKGAQDTAEPSNIGLSEEGAGSGLTSSSSHWLQTAPCRP